MQKAGLLAERENAHLSAVTLGGDIKELRGKFVGVKEGKADKEARTAREELVSCLRVNNRRGLDCWWEVKQFREKVGRLEQEFVEKNQ
jgi:MICOS complex subunit MIC19